MGNRVDVKYNPETGTLEFREISEPISEVDKFLLETARQDLENLFENYLMQLFNIETMNIPRKLSIIAMKYFFKYESDDDEII